MINRKDFEIFASITAGIKKSVEALIESFTALATIIEKEHKAIERSDLAKLESVTAEKEILGQKIVEISDHLRAKGKELKGQLSLFANNEVTSRDNHRESLSIILITLKAVSTLLEEENRIEYQSFIQMVININASLTKFFRLSLELKPKIEMNAYLVNRLLQSHRDTIRLWQEVANESAATYTKKGKSSNQEPLSVLHIKA